MPVQVNEIIIRAVVDTENRQDKGAAETESLPREEIIAECVEQVLEILNLQNER